MACVFFYVHFCAQGVVSNPSGFYRIELLGESDTFVSIPYVRPEAAVGLALSVSDNQVTWKNSPGWTAGQFVYSAGVQTNAYYLMITSGAKEGNYYTITANTTDTLTLNLNGDTLAGLNPGDQAAVVPYWTLGSLFPGGKGVHASSSQFIRRTEIFIPDLNGVGVNLSAAKTYYFIAGHWKQYPLADIKDDDVLLPDAYFIVRHNVATNTTLTVRGAVSVTKWVIPLAMRPSGKQDNIVALVRPNATSLKESGLIESGAFRSSTSQFVRTDELFMFNNALPGKNKSASATYYYYSGAWRRYPSMADVGDEKVFTPSAGFIIRKNPGTGEVNWSNAPTY